MNCNYCNAPVPTAIAEEIIIIDGNCPSSCDDGIVVKIACPYCGRTVFAKTIMQGYATWREWPSWVTFSKEKEINDCGTDEFYISVDNGTLYLHSSLCSVPLGDAENLPDDIPANAELEMINGKWFLVFPSETICKIVEFVV